MTGKTCGSNLIKALHTVFPGFDCLYVKKGSELGQILFKERRYYSCHLVCLWIERDISFLK